MKKWWIVCFCIALASMESFGVYVWDGAAHDGEFSSAGNWYLEGSPTTRNAPGGVASETWSVSDETVNHTVAFAAVNSFGLTADAGATINFAANLSNVGAVSIGVSEEATINQTAGNITINSLTLGSASGDEATYNLTGGMLSLEATSTLNATGTMNIDGGDLVVLNDDVRVDMSGKGLIEISSGSWTCEEMSAAATVFALCRVVIRGGVVTLGAQVIPYQGLWVYGDEAEITCAFFNTSSMTVPTLHFELGADGVSPVNVNSWMHLANSAVTVDGAKYEAATQSITLFDSTNLASISELLAVENFREGTETEFDQDQAAGTEYLKLHVAPPPSLNLMLYSN